MKKMKKMLKHFIILAVAMSLLLAMSTTVIAAPKTMPDGQTFDAEFYAETYPDVKEALGTDEATLYNHYLTYGINEGRKPYAPGYVSEQFIKDAAKLHNYYKNISEEGAAQADAVAKQIADSIMSNEAYTTDLQRVSAAAKAVNAYRANAKYGYDYDKWYRSPYGMFVGGRYTCAGTARALGRVLDYMGYSWEHRNENSDYHQWCILTMDGQIGWADAMPGFAGYGAMTSGMTLPNGLVFNFSDPSYHIE